MGMRWHTLIYFFLTIINFCYYLDPYALSVLRQANFTALPCSKMLRLLVSEICANYIAETFKPWLGLIFYKFEEKPHKKKEKKKSE